MGDITITAAQVGVVFPDLAEVFDGIAAESVVAGKPVYLASSGKFGIADANAAGKQQVRGIALKSVGAGQAFSILKRGHMSGATLSGMAYNSQAYLSDTAGALADAAGTLRVPVGRVVPLTDASLTKVLYVDCDWRDNWS